MRFTLRSGRACELVPVRAPFLRHYYVLRFGAGEPTNEEAAEMFVIATTTGSRLAARQLGRPHAYSLIYSGHASRRAQGWHMHMLLVRSRWAKAWLYFVLAGKNLLQALGARGGRLAPATGSGRQLA